MSDWPMQERDFDLGEGWDRSGLGLYVPPTASRRSYSESGLPIAVDLFAGAGGMSCGLHQAGFHVVGASEFDEDAAITYMVNLAIPGVQIHFESEERERALEKPLAKAMGVELDEDGFVVGPSKTKPPQQQAFRNKVQGGKKHPTQKADPIVTPFAAGSGWLSHYGCTDEEHQGIGYDGKPNEFLADINRAPEHPFGCEHFWMWDARTLTGERILNDLGVDRGEIDLVVGGPPCQGFSMAGRRNVADPRNNLVFEFARIVCELQPKSMVMENVPGILSMVTPEGVPVMDQLCLILEAGEFGTYDALRKSLLISSGSGAALKGRPQEKKPTSKKRATSKRSETEPEPAQEAMAL